jgi:hypothetical protein
MLGLWSRTLLNPRISSARSPIPTLALPAKSSKTAGSNRLPALIMNQTGIDLTNDSDATASPDVSDDEDLRRAIALSLEADTSELSEANIRSVVSSVRQQPQVNLNTLNAFLGIDRKKQEQERLARLKRKRDGTVSPPQLARARRPMANGVARNGIANSTDAAMLPLPTSSNPTDAGGHAPSTSAPLNSRLQYLSGVVKQTWAFSHPRTGNDIKIEEVLQSSTLQTAVLSAFQWDFDWLFPKMDTKRTSFVLVMQAKFESQKKQLRSDFDGIPNVRLCFPCMEGQINCMHSKLMLLFYGEYMRVVVPTGNLRPHDWGESGGIMENTVFLIDLPRSNVPTTAEQQPQFAEDLLYFINAQGLPEDVIQRVHEYDFSRTTGLGFVHTAGGMHGGDSWKLTGHCVLGRTVAGLGLSSKNAIEVDYVTSSVGSLNDEFLRSMYLAAQGDDGLSEYTLRTSKSFPSKCVDDPKRVIKKDAGAGWKEKFRFYYPSDATVRASTGGPDSAGTICFQEKWWNNAKFPKGHMYDCVSRRTGLLMHNKVSNPGVQIALINQ